jgi:hypothetical protein
VSGLKHKRRDHASLMRLNPPRGTDAPLVSGLQPLKSILRSRGAQVIANTFLELEKLFCDPHASGVFARIFPISFTTPISKESGEGIA